MQSTAGQVHHRLAAIAAHRAQLGDGHLLFIEYIVAGRYHLAVVDGKTVGQRDDGPDLLHRAPGRGTDIDQDMLMEQGQADVVGLHQTIDSLHHSSSAGACSPLLRHPVLRLWFTAIGF